MFDTIWQNKKRSDNKSTTGVLLLSLEVSCGLVYGVNKNKYIVAS